VRVSGSRWLSRSLEPASHLPEVRRIGLTPVCAAFVDGAHHFFATCRLATTRRAIMASDVGRGPRAASCRKREGPVRAHSSREWNTAGSPPRGGPEHSLSSTWVRDGLECPARVGVTPWPT
jgi:hypothetical protein